MPFTLRTDKETLQRLLGSGKLTLLEEVDIQRNYDVVVAGRELQPLERAKTNALYDKHKLGEEGAQTGQRRGQARNAELV